MSSTRIWAERCFSGAELGDVRRTKRLVSMAYRTALRPAPHVTQVFRSKAERQAAYDFLEHEEVPFDGVSEALFRSTARASESEERVLIVLDGSSLTLTDCSRAKDFGAIGTYSQGARGIKVMNAVALTTTGGMIGVADQQWWTRQRRVVRSRYRRKDERESRYWRSAMERVGERFASCAPDTKLHFMADREGDAALLICALVDAGHEFTIRSAAKRNVLKGVNRQNLLDVLVKRPVLARIEVDVPATRGCAPRSARLEVRAARLPILFKDRYNKYGHGKLVHISVVWARERSRAGNGDPVEWVLFTSVDVTTARSACETLRRYTLRWRIEDFHRTWKSGLCRVEDTQLRSTGAVVKWATILAAVASRAEHLRRRARDEPNAPATDELTADEIEAVVFLTNEARSSRSKRATAAGLTLATAVRWIADLGGYVGNRGSGPPGATTIGRGLEPVLLAASILAQLRTEGRLR